MQFLFFSVSLILFAAYAGVILYFYFAWRQAPYFKSVIDPNTLSTTISIIIPARNESDNIGKCLRSILDGNYSKKLSQIIVIDDHSTDDTATIVRGFADQNVLLISLKDHVSEQLNSYKKKAIEIALQKASGELIITTDADCIVPKKWLQTIAAFYEMYQPAFIAAPVAINENLNFIELFQSLDFMTLQGITGAAVYKQALNMCNGANLAYERKAFFAVDGFNGIDDIASGDDMLLMHKIFKLYPQRVMYLKCKDAIVQTAPVKTIGQFFNQRIRWASKADKYQDKRILPVLLIVYFFNVLLLSLAVFSIVENIQFSIFNVQCSILELLMILLVLKTLIELLFLYPVAQFFNKTKLLLFFPLMQPFHILYTIVAGWLGKFGKYNWKGREVK